MRILITIIGAFLLGLLLGKLFVPMLRALKRANRFGKSDPNGTITSREHRPWEASCSFVPRHYAF